ncbi:50S ribosomal protein L11 [Candidatus Woesearchaeota archaeon]|nr:50S ribosomal protein L11 [Candidatus Woesearchaeota archaeon]
MAKETVESLVEGGKASAAPPLGPALGPLKINIGQVVAEINKKTAAFAGMKVPIKIIVDTETKEFEILIGTPPASGLVKKEFNLKLGSGIPNKSKIANAAIEDVIKIAKMKETNLSAKNLKSAVKTIIGTCNSMGVLIEGKTALEISPEINKGVYDKIIQAEKTDVSSQKRSELAEQLSAFQKKFAGEVAKMEATKKEKEAAKDKKAVPVADAKVAAKPVAKAAGKK